MWLNHCPINYQERWSTIANVHGHMHHNVITKDKDGNQVPDPYYVNVCCEHVGYTPISMEEIRAKIEANNG
jgi:calcineurin-like phosphoesterase family protein